MPPIQGLGSSRSAPLPTRLLGLLVLTATIGSLVGGGAFGHLLPTRSGPGDVSTPPASATAPRSPGPGSEARAGTDLAVGPAGSAPPQWINVTPTGKGSSPPAAASAVMAYDPDSHATIFFGGCAQSQCPGNQTWAYANGTWSNLTDRKSAPPARYGAVMDYDRNMPGLLLFGGHSAGSTYLNDTWLFQNGDWTNLTRISPTAPAPREYASMAFDPDPEENGSVLFGGHVYNYGPSSDTWIWEGWSGWVFLNTSAPPPVSEYASMAYDPLLHAIVLYGCGDGCVTGDNWTWELYSGQWWQVSASPPAGGVRIGSVMTWDPALSAVLLFGGYSTSYLGDSWTFAGAGWTQLPKLSTDPGGRYVPSMSSDSTGSPPLLFGGSTFYPFGLNPLNDTWVFEVPPTVALSTPAAAEASAPVNLTVSVSNGTAPYRVLFDYGDGAHSLYSIRGPTFSVSHAYLSSGTYYPFVNVTDSAGVLRFGGAAAGTGVAVTIGPSLGPVGPVAPTDVNRTVSLTGSAVTGGHGPYTYTWNFGDGAGASGQDTSHAYSTPGTYEGDLAVTDGLGGSSTVPFEATVNPLPSLVVSQGPGAPVSGTGTNFYGNVSGGTAPFTYAWSFGDGGGSSLPFPSHNYSGAGSYEVSLTVNDSVGATTHASLTVTVQGPHPQTPKGTSSSAGVPIWFWPGIAGLLVVGAVGSYALWRRGRASGGR